VAMFYLVSYDISDDRRRTKLAKTLKDYGDRVQYSVFECILKKDLVERMVVRIKEIVSEEDDNVRIYTLCGQCEKAIRIIGKGEVTKDEDIYIL